MLLLLLLRDLRVLHRGHLLLLLIQLKDIHHGQVAERDIQRCPVYIWTMAINKSCTCASMLKMFYCLYDVMLVSLHVCIENVL
jgi:hypothetical protein